MADRVNNHICIDERDINSGRVMEMTPSFNVDRETLISVPSSYRAEVIVGGERVKTLRSCAKVKLLKSIGVEHLGKQVSVLYVSNRKFNAMSWGIGSLLIRYDFLDGASIHVGADGTLIAEITDAYAFHKECGGRVGTLDLTECTGRITAAFRACASDVLVEMFLEAIQPIFETDFLVSEMDRRLRSRWCGTELPDIIPGVMFKTASVANIRVNEADKNAITERFTNNLNGR